MSPANDKVSSNDEYVTQYAVVRSAKHTVDIYAIQIPQAGRRKTKWEYLATVSDEGLETRVLFGERYYRASRETSVKLTGPEFPPKPEAPYEAFVKQKNRFCELIWDIQERRKIPGASEYFFAKGVPACPHPLYKLDVETGKVTLKALPETH